MEGRGLDCSDVSDAEALLKSIGYYRLSGYLYPFLKIPKEEHLFKVKSSLGKAIQLYDFDRDLRLLIFNQIERIEIAVRSAIVNISCAETNDVFWMTNSSCFAHLDKFSKTKSLIDKELQNTREDFINHFNHVYDNPYPPSWMISEIIPLGVLTRIYENIASNQLRKKIARYFGLTVPVFISWMTIITLTRNTCCHHARLWNRYLSLRALAMNRPSFPWVSNDVVQGKVFFTLCILKHFIDVVYPRIPKQWGFLKSGKSNSCGNSCTMCETSTAIAPHFLYWHILALCHLSIDTVSATWNYGLLQVCIS